MEGNIWFMPRGLMRRSHSIFFLLFSLSLSFISVSYQIGTGRQVGNYSRLHLPYGIGPESLAFDCKGEGPYTGVSDGRILKWQPAGRRWAEFAVTSLHRTRKVCDGSKDPDLESKCGRPLGLQFDKTTCKLYIADASFGLMVVGSKGGIATKLASSAEGAPFRFTNALDIDHENGLVYFTDSSTSFQRRDYLLLVLSGDKTGRLMKYDTKNSKLTVLLKDLSYANGVALSKDKSYIIVAETTTSRILKYWLQGPKANTSELFTQLPANPDNIKRNSKGEFWVALNSGKGGLEEPNGSILSKVTDNAVAVKLDEEGKIVEVLNSNGGKNFESVSEVKEKGEDLWIGSVVMPYVGHYI